MHLHESPDEGRAMRARMRAEWAHAAKVHERSRTTWAQPRGPRGIDGRPSQPPLSAPRARGARAHAREPTWALAPWALIWALARARALTVGLSSLRAPERSALSRGRCSARVCGRFEDLLLVGFKPGIKRVLLESVSQSFFAIATRPPGPSPSGNKHTDIRGRGGSVAKMNNFQGADILTMHA